MTPTSVMTALKTLEPDRKVWIAGSAAICPALASDIDIWVLPKSTLKPEAFSPDIWTEFGENYTSIAHKSIQCIIPAQPPYWPASRIQVMFVNEHIANIYDLLETFDVSCHAYGRNKDGFLVVHPKATIPGKLINWINQPYDSSDDDDEASNNWCPQGECETCDGYWALKEAADAANPPEPKSEAPKLSRIERFTLRYANTTPELLWLPS